MDKQQDDLNLQTAKNKLRRTVSVNATPKGLLSSPISSDEKYVLDANAPSKVPKEKVTFLKQWNWKPRGIESTLYMGEVTLSDRIKNLRWSNGVMIDSEIHVIYLPHLPVENFRSFNVTLCLNFNGTEDDDIKLMSRVEFPVPLHTHIIFYPGHTFSTRHGSKYPWSLHMITDADVKSDYIMADVYVQYKAYNSPVGQHSDKKGANIISLVPISEAPTGLAFTRPRYGTDWKVANLQYGLKTNKDIKTLQCMQESGLDIEGLQNLGVLNEIIKSVGPIITRGQDDTNEPMNRIVCKIALAVVRKKKLSK